MYCNKTYCDIVSELLGHCKQLENFHKLSFPLSRIIIDLCIICSCRRHLAVRDTDKLILIWSLI